MTAEADQPSGCIRSGFQEQQRSTDGMAADHSLFRTCLSRGLSSLPTSTPDHADVTAPCRLQRSLQLEVSARSSGTAKPPAAPHGIT